VRGLLKVAFNKKKVFGAVQGGGSPGYSGITMANKPLPKTLRHEIVPADLFSYDAREEHVDVTAINVTHLLDEVIPGYWSMDFRQRPDYETSRRLIEAWCAAHGAHYYARGREDFSLYEASREAVDMGLTRVVFEDLS